MAHFRSFVMGFADPFLVLERKVDRPQPDLERSFSTEGKWRFMNAFRVGTQVQMRATLISMVLREKMVNN